jgi:CheY-like chemotaxis protein/HPt (histidine-containing phosphotransfer) domain-containing protein
MLDLLECSVRVAGDGALALEAYQEERFDAVLMDCQMPGIDGFEATREIRRREEESGRHIPIIALTANAMKGDREHCISVGMDDYLSKPFGLQELQETLAKWIEVKPSAASDQIAPDAPTPEAEEGAAQTSQDLLNEKILGQLEMLKKPGQPSLLQRMSLLFFDATPKLLADLKGAAASDDARGVADAAHAIKSSSANLGAAVLSDMAAALETTARGGAVPDHWQEDFSALEACYVASCEALRRRIGEDGR